MRGSRLDEQIALARMPLSDKAGIFDLSAVMQQLALWFGVIGSLSISTPATKQPSKRPAQHVGCHLLHALSERRRVIIRERPNAWPSRTQPYTLDIPAGRCLSGGRRGLRPGFLAAGRWTAPLLVLFSERTTIFHDKQCMSYTILATEAKLA